MTSLLVMAGGALGSWLRYVVSVACLRWLGTFLPLGTLAVNVLGSFLLGAVSQWAIGRTLFGVELRYVIGTGVLGGFTTYSSFNFETLRLAQVGQPGRALAYLIATVTLCLGAGALGIAVSQRLR